MREIEKKRILFVFGILFLGFLTILTKAFMIQVVDRDKFIKYFESQVVRETKVYPNRGNIYDRKGNPLAINIQTHSIFTIPKNNKAGNESYKKLSRVVPELSLRKIKRKINGRKRFTWLARKIPLSKEQVQKIKKIKGIYIDSVPKRYYPNHEVLSQAIGFVGLDNVGLSGVEYLFDKELRGKAKIIKYVKDAKGRPLKITTLGGDQESHSLNLSIDKDLQSITEKYLKEGVLKFDALKGGAGIMDADTGEILALANYPYFDPNYIKKSKSSDRKISFISDPFEPGSTLKILTVAAALENKVARPDTNYYCERGNFKVGDHIINEAESKKQHEWLSLTDIIKYSSNIGTTKVAFDIKFPKLKETFNSFKIGKKTGIELPGESRGIFTDDNHITPLSLSNISFGQGVATTGIQLLAAYGAIANGGMYHHPTILLNHEELGIKRKESYRVISEETASQLSDMLELAVDKGTGKNARIPLFQIAGKTSTAQRPNKGGGYSGYISGFVGFPRNVEKKFVVYVYLDKPEKAYYGNEVAAPVFKKIVQYILYKNKDFNNLALPKEMNESDSYLDKITMKKGKTRVSGKGLVPNFLGLDKTSSKLLAQNQGILIKQRGIGVVVKQTPSPGKSLKSFHSVSLIFGPPKFE